MLTIDDMQSRIELLSPAANADVAMAAVNAGADAVYMGGPAFGARSKAGNAMADVERAVRYAHRYAARFFLTLNTLIYEEEMDQAVRIAWQAYEAGVDALIIQDMGLLEAGMPPMELHASTQCHISTPEKARFLEKAGFRRLVLARELSVQEIASIADAVDCEIECFVHGALCASYSGQCYMGCYQNRRSGNRGECSQSCRMAYDLADATGNVLQKNRYLLSMKDLNASARLRELLEAGVCCLKIEGRMKDAAYVKNVTLSYRYALDALMRENPSWQRISQGRVETVFVPDLQKSFHREYTDFNLGGVRKEWAFPSTPKATGQAIGQVLEVRGCSPGYGGLKILVRLHPDCALSAGDGLCYFDVRGCLQGGVLERAEAGKDGFLAVLNGPEEAGFMPMVPSVLYRNKDVAFERGLQSAEFNRKIDVHVVFAAAEAEFRMEDDYGNRVAVPVDKGSLVLARDERTALAAFGRQLSKLGGSSYSLASFHYEGEPVYFAPAAVLNECRRRLVERMDSCRERRYSVRADVSLPSGEGLAFPESLLPSYRLNVANSWAARFYRNHGLEVDVSAFELKGESGIRKKGNLLMICKHCIRFQIGQCTRKGKGGPFPGGDAAADLYLCRGRDKFALRFDCAACRMEVWSV